MTIEELLIDGDVLDGANAFTLGAFEHAVHQQEGVAMRQQSPDAHDVERDRLSHFS